MKNNLLFVSAIVMAISAFSGCQKEEDVKTPVNTGDVSGPITLNFSLSEETKALFGETGIKWTEGDVIRYTDQGLGNVKDITLAASDIKDDGYRATVTTEGLYLANRSVFRMNYSTRNTAEWDYGYYGGCPEEERAANLVFTEWNKLLVKQSEAGVINPYFLFLHSGMNSLDLTGEASVNVPMEILGTILRVMPYTTTHNSETIESISLVSNDKLGGCCGVNYSTGVYRDHKDVNWGPDTFKEYEVQLTTGFSLASANAKVSSKPIYFSLPGQNSGHEINGFAWIVKTDAATYYFSASDQLLSLGHNKVRNVYLNLDNANSVRTTDAAKQLKYGGDVNADKTFDSAAVDNFDLGWWAAQVSDNAGAAWSIYEHTAENEDFYAVTTNAVDLETGSAAGWVSFGYGALSTHLLVSVTENTGKVDRNAKITVTFPAQINGYTVNPLNRTKVFTVCQRGTATITITDAPADGCSFKFDHTNAIYAGESALSWTCTNSDASFVIAVSKNSDMSSAGELSVGAATSVTLTNQFVNAMAAVAGASFGNNTIYYCVRSVGASASEIRNIVVDTEFDSFIDPRDNEIYTVTKIGEKYWMSENMRATKYSDGGELFTNDRIYSTTYSESIFGKREGLFYSFANAVRKYYLADEMTEDNLIGAGDQVQGICPDGWHVANNNDWTGVVTEACSILGESFADIFNGGYPNISKALCFKGDLKETCANEGSNDLGLYILPSNYYYNIADGLSTNDYGWSSKVWSASMYSIWAAWALEFATWNPNIDAWYYGCHPEGGSISAMNVRCVKDY